MTAPRTLLTLSLTLLLLTLPLACTDQPTDQPTGPRTAARLWTDFGCITCHAPDGTGVPGFGPTLHGKKQFWTRVELENYLRDPTGYAMRDPRLKKQKIGFMTPMPPLTSPDPAELTRIVDHVLSMP
jgi:mono/diheme cytochrome c family protein